MRTLIIIPEGKNLFEERDLCRLFGWFKHPLCNDMHANNACAHTTSNHSLQTPGVLKDSGPDISFGREAAGSIVVCSGLYSGRNDTIYRRCVYNITECRCKTAVICFLRIKRTKAIHTVCAATHASSLCFIDVNYWKFITCLMCIFVFYLIPTCSKIILWLAWFRTVPHTYTNKDPIIIYAATLPN